MSIPDCGAPTTFPSDPKDVHAVGAGSKVYRDNRIPELVAALKLCGKRRDLERGKVLHSQAVNDGYHTNKFVRNALITMYGKCRSMPDAQAVFDGMLHQNVVSWTSLILGYVENGASSVAMDLLSSMDSEQDAVTFVAALKACASLAATERLRCLERGMFIHGQARKRGFEIDVFVATNLVEMYSKCGRMQDARAVFDSMVRRDVVTWTSLILGYTENGESSVAMDLFMGMDCEPNAVTVVAALKACSTLTSEKHLDMHVCLEKGLAIHKLAKDRGFVTDIFVANALVDMYSKCGNMQLGRNVFDSMLRPDVVSWNALIFGYVENGESPLAMDLLTSTSCEWNSITFLAALKACTTLAHSNRQFCLDRGMAIHARARNYGYDSELVVANTLVDMYSKCRSMCRAQDVFDNMLQRDVVSWTNLILGYVENGDSRMAIELFSCMDCKPNYVTFVAALKACAGLSNDKHTERQFALERGMGVHKQAKEYGFDTYTVVANTLIDMYAKCHDMHQARSLFDNMLQRDVVSWNVIILGYVENGENLVAMDLFMGMDCKPDHITFVASLRACVGLVAERTLERHFCLEKGMAIHKQAEKLGLDTDVFVGNTLVDMYSKCGSMVRARQIFNSMVDRDVISWTNLMTGYVENGEPSVAIDMFMSMNCVPDSVTFVAVMRACANAVALETGQGIHAQICKHGLEQDRVVATCLVDFYGKCNNMAVAEQVFSTMHYRELVSCSALIAGYSSLGNTSQVFAVIKMMEEDGIQMEGITLLSVLKACNHAGMVNEGIKYFESMSQSSIIPTLEHFTCMVDMLGRSNRLQAALALIRSMPVEADCVIWTTLLKACMILNDMQVGKVAFDAVVACKKRDASAYVLMADMYRRLGMQQGTDT